MKIKGIVLLTVMLLIFIFSSCVQVNEKSLKVIISKEYIYQCNDGTIVKAKYGKLSDNSLNFVKVQIDDGKEYTIPQLVSGSGARYSDEHEIQFWIKGNKVTISKMNENGVFSIIKEGEIIEIWGIGKRLLKK